MPKKEITPLPIVSAEKFRDADGYYVFPFEVLDKTPGGASLGRIEWHMEPFYGRRKDGRYMIEKLLVWASQTRDERYQKVIFEIPCFAECIYAYSLERVGKTPFLARVWRMMFCERHKMPVFSAYPLNEHKLLKINVGSSISIDADFEA